LLRLDDRLLDLGAAGVLGRATGAENLGAGVALGALTLGAGAVRRVGAAVRGDVTVRRFCDAPALGGAAMLRRVVLVPFDCLGRLDDALTRGGAASRSVVSRRVVTPLSTRSVVVRLRVSDERSRKEIPLRVLVADVRLFSVRVFGAAERTRF